MTLSTQFLTMLSMIGMGALFGIMLDTYQRFLQRPKRKHWIVFLNDILFWAIQSLLVFYVLFLINKGEVRFYIFIALLCGFAAYQGMFRTMYLRMLEIIISTFIAFLNFTKKMFFLLVYKPVRGLFQMVLFCIFSFGRGLYTLVKLIFKVLLLILKIISKPIGKTLWIMWKFLPKRIKKNVEKLYNRAAGIIQKIKNSICKWIEKWTKRDR